MGIRWRRILPMMLPVALMAISFSVYVSSPANDLLRDR